MLLRVPGTALLVLLAAAPVGAQHIRPIGTFDYEVEATYEGEPMDPWDTQTVVRDSTVAGRDLLVITSNSRRAYPGWAFVATATVDPGQLVSPAAAWEGNGLRGRAWCEARVDDGRIHVREMYGEQSTERYEGALVPDFTVPVLVATMDLADGDTIRLRPYRCDTNPQGRAMIRVWDMAGPSPQRRTRGIRAAPRRPCGPSHRTTGTRSRS